MEKPTSKQKSVIMVKETFIPRANKSQLVLVLLLLVLVSLAFAAGVLFGPSIVSRRGIKPKDSLSGATRLPDDINLHAVHHDESESVCITADDLKILMENVTPTLKSTLQNTLQGLKSSNGNPATRESFTQSPTTNGKIETEGSKEPKALIMANLTARLNRTFVEILSEKLEEYTRGDVRQEMTRPAVTSTPKPTTPRETPSGSPNPPEATTVPTVICPQGWKTCGGSCYTMKHETSDDWEQARELCRRDNSDLVTIESPEENDFVYELARAEAPRFKYMWIGMRRPSPLGSFHWVDNNIALAYQNWARGEPNNDRNTGENCAHMYISPNKGREGQWNDEKCIKPSNGGPMLSMCKSTPAQLLLPEDETLCSKGWSRFQGSCYTLDGAAPTQSWNHAQLVCSSMNASLVAIDSHDENRFVFQLARVKAPSYKYMWIGLHRSSSLDEFRWSEDNTALPYQNWAKGEPNNDRNTGENCAHMYISFYKGRQEQWNDERCLNPGNGGPMVYMCEKSAGTAEESSGQEETNQSGSGDFIQNEIPPREADIWFEI